MKFCANLVASFLLILAAGCTAAVSKKAAEPIAPAPVNAARVVATMSAAVRLETVSERNPEAFAEMKKLLRQSYPLTFGRLGVEENGPGSLLFTWQGSDAKRTPYLLLAHLDVVPVEAGTENLWEFPPFSGAVENGYVWGRGTLDCKSTAITILAAVEDLIASGFVPRRTLYLAFGDDEEIGGNTGASVLADRLEKRDVRFLFTLDEGMVIADGILPGLDRTAAIIGVAEKGYVTMKITARAPGGHSSMPPTSTAAGRLARAIVRIEEHPMPASLEGPPRQTLEALAPHIGGATGLAIAALPLTEGLILANYNGSPAQAAQVRTTTAVTMLNAGTKENVLPQRAEAIVNFRLRPGDTIADVRTHLRDVIDDGAIEIDQVGFASAPSPVASTTSTGYELISRSIEEVFPGVLIVPGLVLGGTDTRHYVHLSENSLRFGPMRLGRDDISRVHGTNERISTDNLVEMVRFYRRVIQNADALAPASAPGPEASAG